MYNYLFLLTNLTAEFVNQFLPGRFSVTSCGYEDCNFYLRVKPSYFPQHGWYDCLAGNRAGVVACQYDHILFSFCKLT